ncbi:MAG: hypothetical protein NTU44_15885 [Bacteroidetes bacterium]|nr:hypothetical protein [Bacteroidota bacterium]
MNQKQIDYYNSLPDNEKFVLHVAAFSADEVYSYSLPSAITGIKKVTVREVTTYLDNAFKHGLFEKSPYSGAFSVSPGFLIDLIPQLSRFFKEWEIAMGSQKRFYYRDSFTRNLRDLLFCLLFDKKNYPEAEKKYLVTGFPDFGHSMASLLNNKSYREHLSIININIIIQLLKNKINEHLSDLKPISDLEK